MEELLHRPELRLPADERCLQARRPPLTAECRHDAGGAPQPNGFGLPLELVLARVVIGDRRLAQPPRRLADKDGSGRSGGLDARRRIDEVAGDHALALGPDGDRRLAGDDTGAQAEIGKPGLGAEGGLTSPTRSSAVRTARSASSSCAIGAPQTAMTASPMNFSTVPP